MNYSLHFIDRLQKRLAQPLPGIPVQYEMAAMDRIKALQHLKATPDDAKIACVLNLLHYEDEAWKTVLIKRTVNPHDRHSGQVSFPGGRYEPSDASLEAVALREAQEEIGVNPSDVGLLGAMTPLYIPVSNFLVHPFIGVLNGRPDFMPQIGEVESILRPNVQAFTSQDAKKRTDITIYNGVTLKDVPFFEVEGRVVWGATAMMLNEFATILMESLA